MAAQKRGRQKREEEIPDEGRVLVRLANLVALLVVKGEPQADQIRTLALAGYGNSEIAALLGITSNAVNVALHRMRRGR